MSFFMKLFSRRERQRREPQTVAGSRVQTHEEGEFVHVSLSAPVRAEKTGLDEEEADVTSWEMAQVLGRRPAAVVGRRPATTPTLGKRRNLSSVRPAGARRPAAVEAEAVNCMEDPAELDMFDDKRNRIIKRSHRRKMNFPEKYKF